MIATDKKLRARKEAPAPTRQHYKVLDGMRGIAALAVVIFHFSEMTISDYSHLFIAHGFLAVDFFFCLSGFVIAYAYDERIVTMGVAKFLKARLVRLHPLVVLGSALGLIALLVDPFTKGPLHYSAGRLLLMFLASILVVPYPAMQERSFNLFSLNAPAWSLFWEYVASILYAIVLFRLPRRWLLVATLLAGVWLCLVGARSGELAGGWSGPTFWDGGARVAYSFMAGMLVYRSKWIIRTRLGFGGLSVLLVLAFVMPFADGGWVREALVVLFYFPLLIALGAGATLGPRSEKFCTFAGDLSYPLYMTHYVVIWIFAHYYATYVPSLVRLSVVIASGVILMVGFAYLAMVLYDTPVRRYLAGVRLQR